MFIYAVAVSLYLQVTGQDNKIKTHGLMDIICPRNRLMFSLMKVMLIRQEVTWSDKDKCRVHKSIDMRGEALTTGVCSHGL